MGVSKFIPAVFFVELNIAAAGNSILACFAAHICVPRSWLYFLYLSGLVSTVSIPAGHSVT